MSLKRRSDEALINDHNEEHDDEEWEHSHDEVVVLTDSSSLNIERRVMELERKMSRAEQLLQDLTAHGLQVSESFQEHAKDLNAHARVFLGRTLVPVKACKHCGEEIKERATGGWVHTKTRMMRCDLPRLHAEPAEQ